MGLLGIILGTALLAGLGQAILAVVAVLIVFLVKIHAEEQLLLATFPDEYPATANECRSSFRPGRAAPSTDARVNASARQDRGASLRPCLGLGLGEERARCPFVGRQVSSVVTRFRVSLAGD